ncbi:MAG: carboxymuconolactone decarboxylase family protein [Acidobacteria bacterium]|nr:carboxymuconolactone decarboxylase family protein [Acidobacteriota bacterium]
MKAHTAAGKLQGMKEDALWYEAAYAVGMTNALNVVADAVAPYPGSLLMEPVEDTPADTRLAGLFGEICAFYECTLAPLPFRIMAQDPAYLKELWDATRQAFGDNRLSRRLKETLAFAVSVTTRSAFGAAFHLAEMRRLGVSQKGVIEVLGVTQMFSSYTKIADMLQLESDMGEMAPADLSPAPGGKKQE